MKIICFLALCLCPFYTRGQYISNRVWKKNVSRDIDIRDERTGKLSKSTATDSTLPGIIVGGILKHKIVAYKSRGVPVKLTEEETQEAFYGKIDTFLIVCGVIPTGSIKHHQFTTDSIYKYRMYEEWNFYPEEGKINCQMKYIGAIRRFFDEDGRLRADQSQCKLKYDEVMSLLYNSSDSAAWLSLFGNIWKSYFSADTTNPIANSIDASGIWHATATRIIDIQETADTIKHFLTNDNNDTLLSELIVTGIKDKEIKAWSAEDNPFSRRLTRAQLDELLIGEIDTFIYIDQPSNEEKQVITHREFDYATVHKYKILEDWAFDPMTGETEVTIKGIAPIKDIIEYDIATTNGLTAIKPFVIGTKTMFWIHYNDLRKILDRIEQHYPANTFAMHIWDNYFTSDLKPAQNSY